MLEARGVAWQGSGRLQRRGPQTASSFCRDSGAKVKGKRNRASENVSGWMSLKAKSPFLSWGQTLLKARVYTLDNASTETEGPAM